ncbi:32763_t:CDS:2, partial [Racocetra persica]
NDYQNGDSQFHIALDNLLDGLTHIKSNAMTHVQVEPTKCHNSKSCGSNGQKLHTKAKQ